MFSIHHRQIHQLFKITLAEGFALEHDGHISGCYVLMKSGIRMTDPGTAEDVRDALANALEVCGEMFIDDLLESRKK